MIYIIIAIITASLAAVIILFNAKAPASSDQDKGSGVILYKITMLRNGEKLDSKVVR